MKIDITHVLNDGLVASKHIEHNAVDLDLRTIKCQADFSHGASLLGDCRRECLRCGVERTLNEISDLMQVPGYFDRFNGFSGDFSDLNSNPELAGGVRVGYCFFVQVDAHIIEFGILAGLLVSANLIQSHDRSVICNQITVERKYVLVSGNRAGCGFVVYVCGFIDLCEGDSLKEVKPVPIREYASELSVPVFR